MARALARRDIGAARGLGVQHDRQLERSRSVGDASAALHGAAGAGGGIFQSQLRRGLGGAGGISPPSWDALRAAGFALPGAALDNPGVTRDRAAFAQRFAEAYFRTVAEALHRHDPDHLYLGSRFAWQTSEAVEACARWCDVVSFNRYRRAVGARPRRGARIRAARDTARVRAVPLAAGESVAVRGRRCGGG